MTSDKTFWHYKTPWDSTGLRIGRLVSLIVGILGIVAVISLAGCPLYHVWQQELAGKAELARATYNRKVIVQEAEAKKEAAKLLGDAEVARAHGLAEANHIVGASLGGPENYIRYLWIQQIDKVSGQVIYVPTEAGLPLTEATRLAPTQHVVVEKK